MIFYTKTRFTNYIVVGLFSISYLCTIFGCATVTQGTSQPLTFTSSPDGARVIIKSASDRQEIVTPMTISLSKSKNYVAIFQKDDYQTVSCSLVRGSSGWQLGNILLGGTIGTIVDARSGGGAKFEDTHIHVDLVPKTDGQ